MPTDDQTDATPKRSRARTAALALLMVAGVAACLAVVVLRGMDGPLVLDNDGKGGTAPATRDRLVAATVRLEMPEGAPATIKAVRTKVDAGLKVEEAYVWRRAPRTTLWATVASWPLEGKAAPEKGALKQPGNFEMSTARTSPDGDTLVSVVVRPTREGRHTLKWIEVDYTRGLRRHRKVFKVGFAACVNPAGTKTPKVDFCAAAPGDGA